MQDPLTDVLRLLRLDSCVYFLRDFWSPWGMRLEASPFAQFHVVVRGDCVVEAGGGRHYGQAGDVFVFPRGLPHGLADQAGREMIPGPAVLASLEGEAPCFAEGQKATRLLCGHYAYSHPLRHPLIDQLPDFLQVRCFDAFSTSTIGSVLPLLVEELDARRPGAQSVIERLAEILLIQVLRAHFTEQPESPGFLAGVSDPKLAPAIALIHARPQEALTLDSLARRAGMSRSAFALRFKEVVGLSPIEYLATWRLLTASSLLADKRLSLAQVAEQVGYESEVSFARAFKRHFEVTPAAFRRRDGALPEPA